MATTRRRRTALECIRGVVQAGGAAVGPRGLDLHRPRGCQVHIADAARISDALETLGIEHALAPAPSAGVLVRVEWEHLPALRDRMPELLDPLLRAADR